MDTKPQLLVPFSMIVSGSSGVGKSQYLAKLLTHRDVMFEKPFSKIYFSYVTYQPVYDEIKASVPEIEFVEGVKSDIFECADGFDDVLYIIDDMMTSMGRNYLLVDLFTKARPRKLSVIFVTHDLYFGTQITKNVLRSTMIFILFKNISNAVPVQVLSRQIRPDKPKYIIDSFMTTTARPFNPLILILMPQWPENLRVLSGILPTQTCTAFLPV